MLHSSGTPQEHDERLRLAPEFSRAPRDRVRSDMLTRLLNVVGVILLAVREPNEFEDVRRQMDEIAQRTRNIATDLIGQSVRRTYTMLTS